MKKFCLRLFIADAIIYRTTFSFSDEEQAAYIQKICREPAKYLPREMLGSLFGGEIPDLPPNHPGLVYFIEHNDGKKKVKELCDKDPNFVICEAIKFKAQNLGLFSKFILFDMNLDIHGTCLIPKATEVDYLGTYKFECKLEVQ